REARPRKNVGKMASVETCSGRRSDRENRLRHRDRPYWAGVHQEMHRLRDERPLLRSRVPRRKIRERGATDDGCCARKRLLKTKTLDPLRTLGTSAERGRFRLLACAASPRD